MNYNADPLLPSLCVTATLLNLGTSLILVSKKHFFHLQHGKTRKSASFEEACKVMSYFAYLIMFERQGQICHSLSVQSVFV